MAVTVRNSRIGDAAAITGVAGRAVAGARDYRYLPGGTPASRSRD
jgi:hypothetical protein